MRYLSVCSGIEAATCAWHPLGWVPFAFSEIEPFPSAVLAHHYPDVPNFGDMTKFKEWPDADVDVLVGGTPCQSFSVAGLRKGLADPRGNLMLTYLAIADRYQPEWIVWENVPGVLSSGSGRDFGTFLGALGQIGYGWAYRVLDAQFFGVPQRRRRVFVVGHLGDWRRAAAVLFERHSLQGHPPPSREKREGVARPITAGSRSSSGYRNDADTADNLIHCTDAPRWPAEVGSTLNAHYGDKWGLEDQHALGGAALFVPGPAHSLRAEGFDASEDGTGRGTPLVPISIRTAQTSSNGCGINEDGTSYTLDGAQGQAIAFDCKASGQNGFGVGEIGNTMRGAGRGGGHQAVMNRMQVRRLTPRECERLQGFPDDYTLIPITKRQPINGQPAVVKWAADGPRYKALGNSMAVPVMRWIGERIAMVDAIPLASEIAA